MIVKVRRAANADEYFKAYEPFLVDVAKTDSPEMVAATGRSWLEAFQDHLNRDGSTTAPEPVTASTACYSRTMDGLGVLDATFRGDQGEIVHVALDLAYEHGHRVADPRSATQQRADAFVEICQAYIDSRPATGNRPNILFINELAAFDGHIIQRGETSHGHHLATETVRRYSCFANLNIIDTHNGIPLRLGRTKRIFTPHQYRAMTVRDGGCRGPNCNAPPSRCQSHHINEWAAHHGETNISHGILLCRGYCHTQVHEGGWTITGDANDTLTFTNRDGQPIGTTQPRKPNPKYLTQKGQDHQAIHDRLTQLTQQIHHNPPPH